MIERAFQVGDTVQLKSGGPGMTVESIDDRGGELCFTWFNRARQTRSYFDPRLLKHVEPGELVEHEETQKAMTPPNRSIPRIEAATHFAPIRSLFP